MIKIAFLVIIMSIMHVGIVSSNCDMTEMSMDISEHTVKPRNDHGTPPACVDVTNPIALWDGYTGKSVSDGGIADIGADARMPGLIAAHCTNYSDNVIWSLTIYANQSAICKTSVITGRGNPWKPDLPWQGGIAMLTGCDSTTGLTGVINFKIVGTQPNPVDVIRYIRSMQGNLWFAEYIARKENQLKHFDSAGYPFSSNNRYGIFNIPPPGGFIIPTCSQIWQWKANVDQGIKFLQMKLDEAYQWMNCNCTDKNCAKFCSLYPGGGQRIQAQLDTGLSNASIVPMRKEANCIFQDGTARTIEDAVAIMMYGTEGSDKYCYWDRDKHVWGFKSDATYCGRDNYLDSVCYCMPPCTSSGSGCTCYCTIA